MNLKYYAKISYVDYWKRIHFNVLSLKKMNLKLEKLEKYIIFCKV